MKQIVDGRAWRNALRKFDRYDFYHTYDYHALVTNDPDDQPCLFVYEGADSAIAIPLLIRHGHIGGTEYVDVTSVYGYAGPLVAGNGGREQDVHAFQQDLATEFRNLAIVSAFSRLHPLLASDEVLRGLGDCDAIGETVSIDLCEPEEQQWRRYRSNHRRDINKLKKQGVICEKSERPADLAVFCKLYAQTMQRVDAAKHYRFADEYFERLVNAADFDMHLFVCRSGETVVCAGLFSSCNGVIQYHLGATADDFLKQTPSKLMFDTVRSWGVSRGMRTFHLGGGVGSKQDSLYHFKRGFSDIVHYFRVWRWIFDQQAYDNLIHRRDEIAGACRPKSDSDDYFPAYRAPV